MGSAKRAKRQQFRNCRETGIGAMDQGLREPGLKPEIDDHVHGVANGVVAAMQKTLTVQATVC